VTWPFAASLATAVGSGAMGAACAAGNTAKTNAAIAAAKVSRIILSSLDANQMLARDIIRKNGVGSTALIRPKT
jgi:hypothetical protein